MSVNPDQHRLRHAVDERLGRENMLDFGGPDPERQSPEGAMRRGVAVTADHDHARAHQPLLIHQHMLDTLMRVVRAIEGLDAELAAVLAKLRRLTGTRGVLNNAGGDILCRNDMVNHAEMGVRRQYADTALNQSCKSLRTRVLIREVDVDVQQNRAVIDSLHRVGVDDFLIQRLRFSRHVFLRKD